MAIATSSLARSLTASQSNCSGLDSKPVETPKAIQDN
jgi:hypothetical protein